MTLISGPSGAGKSTFINILSGIIPPTEGTILIMGQNLKADFKKIKPHISCVWNELPYLLICQLLIRFFSFFERTFSY
jgi:ABC-2 type transport system ATP-binding protein